MAGEEEQLRLDNGQVVAPGQGDPPENPPIPLPVDKDAQIAILIASLSKATEALAYSHLGNVADQGVPGLPGVPAVVHGNGAGSGVAAATHAANANTNALTRAAAARVAGYSSLHQRLEKSAKVKDYKLSSPENIREWIARFNQQVASLAPAVSLDLESDPLTQKEYINLIKSKLDFSIITEMELKFTTKKLTWASITKEQLHNLLIEQFGAKEPEIASLLKYFNPSRPKKTPETNVRNFFCQWYENLPLCVKPNTVADREKCVDLLHRTLFYHALDDAYLQRELSNIPEADQTLNSFHEEAIKAEGRRSHYQGTTEKCNVLDASASVNINKFEYKSPAQPSGNRGTWRGGRGGRGWKGGSSGGRGGGGRGASHTAYENNSGGSSTQHHSKSTKVRIKCTYCKRPGHKQEDCYHYIDFKKSSTNKTSIEEDSEQDFGFYKVEIKHESNNNVGNGNVSSVHANTPVSVCSVHASTPVSVCVNANSVGNTSKETRVVIPGSIVTTSSSDINTSVKVITDTNATDTFHNSASVTITPVQEVVIKAANSNIVQNIMGGVILNDNISCQMELDTAACHCIMSYDRFKEIVSKSKSKPPTLVEGSIRMNMADGTPSTAVKGSTVLSITRADKPEMTGVFTVVIVDGPHALLGRPALQALWPEQYNNFASIAKKSLDAMGTSSACSACINYLRADERKCSGGGAATTTTTTTTTAIADTSACAKDAAAAATKAADTSTHRSLPPFPTGNVTQEEGEAYCKQLCKEEFSELFDGGIGLFKNVEAEFYIKPGHEKFLKVYPPAKVPHGIKPLFDKKLDKVYETGIPVDGRGLRVATQLVAVVKKREEELDLRICGNFKRSINDHIQDHHHQYSSVNEQLGKLKGVYYTCLDFSGAYNQVSVKPECRSILTLNTPRGFVEPTRMPFGVKTAPAIFQAGIDRLIHGMDGKPPVPSTACIVDDICITGANPQEHFANLSELLLRLREAGLKLNKDKCKFYQTSVKFLGKIIDKNGQRMDPAAVDAIVNMPAPTDKHTLRSFLGHMSYVSKHVPDIRIARASLDALLKKDVKFVWNESHSKAFDMCKKLASNSAILAHFDEKLPLVLTTDASPVGLGACLSHRVTEGGKTCLKPLHYASCSLKPAELNYAQIDREGLAVHWATTHFRQFLYCRKFELHTDCSALTRIFGSKNDLGGCAIGRLNRWAAALMEYDFHATHIKGSENNICDSLSRLPVPPKGQLLATSPTQIGQSVSSEMLTQNMSVKYALVDSANGIMEAVQCLAQLPDPKVVSISICKVVGTAPTAVWDILPLGVKDIAKATREDKVFGKLLSAIRSGEIDKNDLDMKPFVSIFDDLYVEQGVIFHGSRVVVPTRQQERLLEELHMTHMGVVKMKGVAREYFYWPLINKHIENIANSCSGCNKFKKRPAPAPLCPWPYARRPMERVHIDFCEYKGKQLLVLIDAHSKYIWTHVMNNDTTTLKTLAVLWSWFCERSGFPATLVSDNGPQFTSKEFAEKMAKWGVKHILTPPYHPASNGLAEKAVGIVKTKLKKMDCSVSPVELHVNLHAVLRVYRSSPHTSTGQTPYELISSAPVPVMFPRLQLTQQKIQETQRSTVSKDRIRHARTFQRGDSVLVYDTQTKVNSSGIVKECKSNNSYIVTFNDRDKHISGDHMRLSSKDCVNDKTSAINDNMITIKDSDRDSNVISDDKDVSFSDNESIVSDDSEIVILPISNDLESDFNDGTNSVHRRLHKPEHEKLIDSLTTTFPGSRTRSGNTRPR